MTALVEVCVADLTGPALDFAVAKAEGLNPERWKLHAGKYGYSPSTDWSQGGPLIDKHRISFVTIGTGPEDEHGNEPIVALVSSLHYKVGTGTTHLTAACRAIVATVLGETVSVPADLVKAVQP